MLDADQLSILQWVKYTDAIGYMPYEEFLQLPNTFVDTIMAIRTAYSIKDMRSQLKDTKGDARKKLTDNINELENFFL